MMASTVLRGSVFRRAARTAAAATLPGAERARAALLPAHRRSLLHSSARGNQRPKSWIAECDALYEAVRGTEVSSLKNDVLSRIIESSQNACTEFVQNDLQRTWMICAATAGGFFTGCLMKAWKIDNEKMSNEREKERYLAEETYDIL